MRARVCERQFLCQIAVGALKSVHKCIPTRDVPAPVCLSVERTATAEQVLQQGRNSLFPGDNGEFFLGNAKNQKISGLIENIPWILKEYLRKHSIAPSKCKLFVVKVQFINQLHSRSLFYLLINHWNL